MANEFKIKNGLVSDGNIVVTGSITATGGINISGSIASAETASFAPSYTLSSSFNSYTSSASSSVGSLSSSVATTTSGLASRIGSVETKTGSYATTGSNVFVGSQVITGSLYITNDMVVQGCSCLQNITASAVSIGTNTVVLNTATPAVRFAGVSVQDSGSNAGVTGSIYWDGLCNRWVYSNPSGIGYSGGMLLSGPRTSTLGSESPLICNYIAKSGGGDHLYDSCIIDDGTTVCVNAKLEVRSSDLNNIFVTNPDTTGTTTGSGIGFRAYNGTSVAQAAGIILTSNTWNYGTYSANQLSIGADGTGGIALRTACSAPISFFTGGDTAGLSTERIRITATGVVGIGSNNPVIDDGNLVVAGCVGTGQGATNTVAQINIWETTSANKAGLWFGSMTNANTGVIGSRTATGNIAFQTYCGAWAERMRIAYNGNVGIGTSSNLYGKLSVEAPGNHITLRAPAATAGKYWALDVSSANQFYVINNAGTQYFTMTDAGNFGIGAPSPSQRFHVANSAGGVVAYLQSTATNGEASVALEGRNSSGTTRSAIFKYDNEDVFRLGTSSNIGLRFETNDVVRLTLANNGAATFTCNVIAGNVFASYSGTNAGVEFGNSGSGGQFGFLKWDNGSNYLYLGHSYGSAFNRNLVINSSGNVGIGATAPSSLLHICGAGTGAMLRLQNISTVSGDQGPLIQFMSANQVGNQNFETGYIQSIWQAEGNAFGMRFATKGVDASQSEKMRITENGNVLIGKTSDTLSAETVKGIQMTQTARLLLTMDGSYSPFSRLSSDGDIITFHRGSPSKVGSISVTTSAVAYNTTSSDIKLKKNFENWNENVSSLFEDINPQKFNFTNQENGTEKIKGFIAQCMIHKFPEAYPLGDNGYYSFNPSGMTTYLMKAIQEQQCTINTLKTCLGII
jgi:hypothetical protein